MPDISAIVTAALSQVLDPAQADDLRAKISRGEDVAIEDLALDSLSRFDVMMQIEDALDVELDDDEMLAQGSVAALISYLQSSRAKV